MTSNTLKFLIYSLLLLLTTTLAAESNQGLAAYQQGDYPTALALLAPLARQGDPEAQYTLGMMYDDGDGLSQDYQQAARWFRAAAEQGHAQAQRQLGRLYFHGLGLERNLLQAYAWFNLATAQGDDRFGMGRNSLKLTAAQLSTAELEAAQALARRYQQRYQAPSSSPTPSPPSPSLNPVPPAPSSGGDFQVQLASLSSMGRARSEQQRLQRLGLLSKLQFTIQKAQLNRGTVHRLQAGPLSRAEANALCKALQQQAQPCLVVRR